MFRSSTLARYSLREARRRPGRALLTVLGVAIGVATFVAVATGVVFTRDAYTGLFAPLTPHAALEVVAEGQGPFAPDLDGLADVRGVESTLPVVQLSVGLPRPGTPVSLLLLGVTPGRETELCGCQTTGTEGLRLEEGFAARHGLVVGENVRVAGPDGPIELELTGLLEGAGPASFNHGAVGLFPLAQAQMLVGAPGQVHSVLLTLAPGVGVEEVRAAVQGVLPPGLRVQSPAQRGGLAADLLLTLEQFLVTISVTALVAGVFVVLNTFFMSLNERRRNLALLRAVGATRGQLTILLFREALLLGVLGTLLGLPIGMVLAHGLHHVHEYALGLSLPTPRPGWVVILLACLLGPGLGGLAVLVHARRASLQSPLEALSSRPVPPERIPTWAIAGLGLTLQAAGLLFVAGLMSRAIAPHQATPWMPVFLVVCLVGCAQLLPVLVPALLNGFRLFAPWMGVEGRLALRHLQRHPPRTILTAAVLVIALIVSTAFGNSFLDSSRNVQRWYDRTIDADLLLRVALPDPALVLPPPEVPPGITDAVARWEGVASVDRVRFLEVRAAGVPALLIARDFQGDRPLPFLLSSGEEADCLERIRKGEVLLAGNLAQQLQVGVGDSFELATRAGPVRVRVCGVGTEYTVGGKAFYMDWDRARALFSFRQPHALAVRTQGEKARQAEQDLRSWCAGRGLMCQTHEEFRWVITRLVGTTQTLLDGLLGLVFVVSGLGIANTLSTFVLEQTRELGVLRAVGLTRRQLGRVVLSQAALLVGVSLLPGLGFGVYLAFLLNVSSPAMTGQVVPFHIRPWLLAGCAAGAGVLALLAALVPAWRAARLPVLEALRYE